MNPKPYPTAGSVFIAIAIPAMFLLFAGTLAAQVPAQLPLLSEKLRTGTIEEKREALYQIRNLEDPIASQSAVPALRDPSEMVRAAAVFSILAMPPDRATELLTPLLSDRSPFVRRETAYALGETGDADAARSLTRTLKMDRDREVQSAAAMSLGKIGGVGEVIELTDILRKKPKQRDEFLRRSAARSIGQIAQFVQTGQRQMTTPADFLPYRDRSVGAGRYENLTEMFAAFRFANEVLIVALRNGKEFADVKRDAAFALGAIGDKSSTTVLTECRDAADYILAEVCKNALAKVAGAGEN